MKNLLDPEGANSSHPLGSTSFYIAKKSDFFYFHVVFEKNRFASPMGLLPQNVLGNECLFN